MELSNGFVCAMGMGVVFVGLICIVLLCYLMSFICKDRKQPAASAPAQGTPIAPAPIANKQEILAGVCAVIAEELGTEVQSIRVLSFKKV